MPEESDISREAIKRIGGDPDNLGFVGLKVNLPSEFRGVLDPTWAYHSPKLEYVKGYQGQPHITLIYGLLFAASENRDLIDKALENVHVPNLVVMPGVEAFDGDDGRDLYSAIVLTLDTNEWDLRNLKAANDELRKLPHVNGFPIYKPHVTLGYVRREFKDLALNRVKDLEIRPLVTGGLEYS